MFLKDRRINDGRKIVNLVEYLMRGKKRMKINISSSVY